MAALQVHLRGEDEGREGVLCGTLLSLCSNPWGIEAHTGPMMLSEGAASALVAALVGLWEGRGGGARGWMGDSLPLRFRIVLLLLLPLLQTRYMNTTVPAPGATAPRDYSLLVLACQVRTATAAA